MEQSLEVLDKVIEELHQMVQDLQLQAHFVLGVEWTPHKTRPGLHPVVYRRKGRVKSTPFVRPGGEPSPRRPWGVEIKAGYLQRQVSCMPGQEALARPYLEEALALIRTLMEEREDLMAMFTVVRRMFTARRKAIKACDVEGTVGAFEQRSAAARAVLFSKAHP